ncbi:uncharacterized protein BCR38DRAFT_489304 [Pseudomassariella vexata]|uniref:Carbohydrate esterase family 16 protein n=1 Tax=Pseudomassariella vexata TaxID=1141098 RepID=A0A1Y2DGG1_9PEZI|nr:uncharacterized protein BCR38DRAFT_489304 [Pseudomassariella vexata]ORY58381.1 hypothetical protein BCR38DRAFT_489304 [Pseudomassariella vexata]
MAPNLLIRSIQAAILTFAALHTPNVQAQAVPNGVFWDGLGAIRNLWVAGASIEYIGSFPFDWSTTANGPNHINYIVQDRQITLQKFAYPGAVTDPAYAMPTEILPGFSPIINWPDQINNIISLFNMMKSAGSATMRDSLFVFTASNTGNDVLNTWNTTNDQGQLIDGLVATMRTKFGDLYNAGARNFIFLSVLPAQYIPEINILPASDQATVAGFVANYQSAIDGLVNDLRDDVIYSGQITIFQPNFTPVLIAIAEGTFTEGPTAGYLNRTGYCPEYLPLGILIPPNPDFQSGNCLIARKYLFHDMIHFTSPAHCEYALNTLTELGDNRLPSNCQFA